MGNNFSSPPILPLTFGYCFSDGCLDINNFQIHMLVKRKQEDNLMNGFVPVVTPSSEELCSPKKKRKCRTMKKNYWIIQEQDGRTSVLKPTNSLWFTMYVQTQPTIKRQQKLFCQRFRMSHD